MACAADRMSVRCLPSRSWQVQVFPEGTRSRDPSRMNHVRPGVGRLVHAAASAPGAPAPIVLPFAHAGMERVLPVGAVAPRVGQQVSTLPCSTRMRATDSWVADALARAHQVLPRLP